MNAEEIIALAKKLDIDPELVSNTFDETWPEFHDVANVTFNEDNIEETTQELQSFGKVKLVEQEGGEGEGDHYHLVFHFEDHDVYLKADAYYNSNDGTDWSYSYWYEVRPKEITKIIYE